MDDKSEHGRWARGLVGLLKLVWLTLYEAHGVVYEGQVHVICGAVTILGDNE